MSLKDDFIEAFRSVKRDFFREAEYTEFDSRNRQTKPEQPAGEGENIPHSVGSIPPEPAQPRVPPQSEEVLYRAFRQASAVEDKPENDNVDDIDVDNNGTVPYARFDPSAAGNDVYGDEKTIISKNTIIHGSLQTEDSLRLLGQVLGDIECKSNLMLAGKVRGNTAAANAYIYDAQVDGDVRCDDMLSISADAWILGNIRAQQAEIEGKIKGNIEIRHSVSIGSSSSILGDISTDELEIRRGAFVNGQIMMYSPQRDVLDRFEAFEE